MAFLSLFSLFFIFHFLSPLTNAASDDVFPTDVSRMAEGWIPVAQCRADCLNGFGLNFGLTTMVGCNQADQCLACWQDCACNQFQPNPPWAQCSPPQFCFAGCRRADVFYRDTANQRAVNDNGTVWSLISSAILYDKSTLSLNNTLVDRTGKPYTRREHLIFSVSLYSGGSWIQLTQSVGFVSHVDIHEAAPECEVRGCLLRTAAVDSSSFLAENHFTYFVTRTVNVNTNISVIKGPDSTLSVALPWPPSERGSNTTDEDVFQLVWTKTLLLDSAQPDSSTKTYSGTANISRNTQGSPFVMNGLTYNSTYNATIIHNTSVSSVRYEYHFTTPGCTTQLRCGENISVEKQNGKSMNETELQKTALIIGGSILALFSSVVFYLLLRRFRGRGWKSSPSDVVTGEFRMAPLSGRRPRTSTEPIIIRPQFHSQTELLINPPYEEITQGVYHDINAHYFLTDGHYGEQRIHLVVKRIGKYQNEEEKRQLTEGLNAEMKVLTAVRQQSAFVRLVGTSLHEGTPVLLFKFEEHYKPLNELLQVYRHPKVLKANNNGEVCLGPAPHFGAPGTAFLRHLTGAHILNMAEEVASGLAYLNSRKWIHGALCARNILCNADFHTKIHGFSNVSYLDKTEKKTSYNTRYNRWMPVEVLQSRAAGIGMKTDVWSFGVLMWEILTLGSTPYPRGDTEWLVEFLSRGRLEQSPLCSSQLYEFLLECWNADVSKRPSMLDVHERLTVMVKRRLGEDLIKLTCIGDLDKFCHVTASYISSLDNTSLIVSESMEESELRTEVPFSLSRTLSQQHLVLPSTTPVSSLKEQFKKKYCSLRDRGGNGTSNNHSPLSNTHSHV